MRSRCPHQPASSSDGRLIAGQCPQCLLDLAIDPSLRDEAWPANQPSIASDSAGAEEMFSPGTVLGRFQIVARIGKGGMGEVYRANDLSLGQSVALKFLPREVQANPYALLQLSREVRIGREVTHPNVCRIHDIAEADGQHFIVMELIEGEDLATLLSRLGTLRTFKTMEIARDLCAGLGACHDRGVIHGDLKPGNVMIDADGRVRIMDFGLSSLVGGRPEERMIGGTIAYIAPEQLHGSGPTAAADIYALGLVLHELFTGHRVHDVATLEELRAVIDIPPVSPSARARLAPGVGEMILRCLDRVPARRPRSPEEVGTAFPPWDPIAAALATGETLSPRMIAASRDPGDISVTTSWSLLSAGIIGLLVTIALVERFSAVGRADLRFHGGELAEKARAIGRAIAYEVPVTDHAYGFSTRAQLHGGGQEANPNPVFFYRESSQPFMPTMSLHRIRPSDPPLDRPGMSTIGLTPDGSLRFLKVIPAAESSIAAELVGWEQLFGAAGLDAKAFVTKKSSWMPPVPYQEKAEWTIANNSGPRVRAALHTGRAVYFEVVDDSVGWLSGAVAREGRFSGIARRVYVALLILTFVVGGFLARRNIRLRKSDLRGAGRLAGLVLVCRLLFWFFTGELGAGTITAQVLVRWLGQAFFESAQVWLAYVAFEPHLRKNLPRLIIGWNRLMEGKVFDPLVGRDLLFGSVLGVALAAVEQIRGWSANRMGLPPPQPTPLTLESLSGWSEILGVVFYGLARSVVFAALGLFLFLLLTRLVKNRVVAGTIWILIAAVTWTREPHGTMLSVALTVAIVGGVLSLIAIARFGLLASLVMFFVYLLLVISPLTFDMARWYAPASMMPVLIVLVLVAFSFHTALGGKPPFGRRLLDT